MEAMEARKMAEEAKKAADKVFNFLGVGPASGAADFYKQADERVIRTPSALQVTQPIYTGSLGRWKQYWPLVGSAFGRLAPIAERLGYETGVAE